MIAATGPNADIDGLKSIAYKISVWQIISLFSSSETAYDDYLYLLRAKRLAFLHDLGIISITQVNDSKTIL